MAFKMSPIGKNKCSYSPMKEKGLISPVLVEDKDNEATTKPNYKGKEGVKGGHRVEIKRADGSKSYATEMNDSIYVNGRPVSKKALKKAGQTIVKV